MNNSQINQQQIFAWAIALTSQPDYHTLTYYFLEILGQLAEVEQAAAYEIYGGSNRQTGQANSSCEQLIRRFPLDLDGEIDEENVEILKEINQSEGLSPNTPDTDSLFSRVVVSMRGMTGPDRALLLTGKFNTESLNLLDNLVALYKNQIALHDSKERDTLTKLLNRQSFNQRLTQVCEYFQQHPIDDIEHDKSSWLALLDIDHFKRINDGFGHLYGDEVLLIFSQLLEKNFRYNDFLFRFGGEEFVVILNLVNKAAAEATFERFRETVANHPFPTVGQVTISIGMVHIDSATMPTTLLDRADQAMYQAKNEGRNQLKIYENSTPEAEFNHEPDLF